MLLNQNLLKRINKKEKKKKIIKKQNKDYIEYCEKLIKIRESFFEIFPND